MARRTSVVLARQTRAFGYFDDLKTKVFMQTELASVLEAHRADFGLPASHKLRDFIRLLSLDGGRMRRIEILPLQRTDDQGKDYLLKKLVRYVWGEPSGYAVAVSMRPGAYLSHASALFLHGLTQQIPKTIYVNKEQSAKVTPRGILTQEGIDRAFQNNPRVSNYIFSYNDDYRIVVLSGKQTGRLEVSPIETSAGERLDVTKLERTLIDCVVRPVYAGGPLEVLDAFRLARSRISVQTLIATLKRLDYVYPYHQALGFYMQRAGYDQRQLDRVLALGLAHDFYLANKMIGPSYDKTWRLYYPQGLA